MDRWMRAFFAGTMLSRVSGLFRDVAMAASFGVTPEVAAFFVAFRLSNLFRRFLGEGNIQAGFVPHYKDEGFYRDCLLSLGVVLLVVVAALELVIWGAFHIFESDVLRLSLWMTPGLFFICLYGLNAAYLQCLGKFFLPAAAPIAFNFVWGLSALYFQDVTMLAKMISVAFFAQWLVTLKPFNWRGSRLFPSEVRALVKPISLGMIGVSAVQINSALDPMFARITDIEGPAFLWYAIRVEQLPLALFGLAMSSALLPMLSRAEFSERPAILDKSLARANELMAFFTCGILALGLSGLNLLYGHGDFSGGDVLSTLYCLLAYGLGLTPSVLVLLLSQSHFANHSYRKPALTSIYSVGLNLALNVFFIFAGLGAVSIALATSFSAFFNMYLLGGRSAYQLSTHLKYMPAALLTLFVGSWFPFLPRDLFSQASAFLLMSLVYSVPCFFLSKIYNRQAI